MCDKDRGVGQDSSLPPERAGKRLTDPNAYEAMSASRGSGRTWIPAVAVGAAAALGAFAVGGAALALQARHDVAAAGDALARRTDRLAAGARLLPPASVVRPLIAGGGARVVSSRGRILAQSGPRVLWQRGDPGWTAGLTTMGVGGWRLLDGGVESRSPLAGGTRLVTRAPVPMGAGTVGGAALGVLLGGAAVVGIAAGLVTFVAARRRAAAAGRLLSAAESLAAGRPAAPGGPIPSEWASLADALARASERTRELVGAAETGFDGVGAFLAPLAQPAAARTPSGGRLRNAALEHLLTSAAPEDATVIERAVGEGLDAGGALARALALGDGRTLEVESWPAAGGRVVTVGERTEQERLRALRRRISGAATRHLLSPVVEIQRLGGELVREVPAALAPTAGRLLAAADRLERLVTRLLRGTADDPRMRPPRREPVGLAGLLWGLAHEWDRELRTRALRVELDVDHDLPEVRTDPALVREVLTQLVDNAARYTPRGGTVRLAARPNGGAVSLEVADTGPGLERAEAPHATERFFRGQGAEAIPGAGLGLGVAAALAERIDGRLVVEPGPGGRARLELPVEANGGAIEERAAEAAEPAGASAR
jgi:signal transduction histidine kinase